VKHRHQRLPVLARRVLFYIPQLFVYMFRAEPRNLRPPVTVKHPEQERPIVQLRPKVGILLGFPPALLADYANFHVLELLVHDLFIRDG